MNHTILSFCAVSALAAAAAAQYPTSSTLPRGEVLLTAAPTNNDVIGFGFWRTCAPVVPVIGRWGRRFGAAEIGRGPRTAASAAVTEQHAFLGQCWPGQGAFA